MRFLRKSCGETEADIVLNLIRYMGVCCLKWGLIPFQCWRGSGCDPVEAPPRTHLVNRVNIEGQDWISDVGFGGRAARVPLKIEDGYEVDDGDGRIRISTDADFGYRISRYQDSAWSDQYTVETEAAHSADILSGNHWTESHPQSHFRLGMGVGLFTEDGRTSFYGGVLTHRGAQTHSQTIKGLSATLDVLKSEFGLDLDMSAEEQARLGNFVLE